MERSIEGSGGSSLLGLREKRLRKIWMQRIAKKASKGNKRHARFDEVQQPARFLVIAALFCLRVYDRFDHGVRAYVYVSKVPTASNK
jgi:hypothetical protein